jgi:hypothetical protein
VERDRIIEDFLTFIKNRDGYLHEWYVGLDQDAEKRLFADHHVDKKNGAWIYRIANSNREAREVVEFFLNKAVTDGESDGRDSAAIMVYAYKKASKANP